MPVEAKYILVNTTSDTDIIDITETVTVDLMESGIINGTVNLFVPGSTAALTTIEYESGVINDLKGAIEKIAPMDIYYEHNERWGDGNGYSHVRAALMGASLSIPIVNGSLTLGTWQQIVLLDFDNHPRQRKIVEQFIGV
ncbi:secondary thiamine-phosphate synthase enzyme YjbQ [Thermodesulfobacteriota bacterium]